MAVHYEGSYPQGWNARSVRALRRGPTTKNSHPEAVLVSCVDGSLLRGGFPASLDRLVWECSATRAHHKNSHPEAVLVSCVDGSPLRGILPVGLERLLCACRLRDVSPEGCVPTLRVRSL